VSGQAFDGSNNFEPFFNVWSINSDCSGNAPVTQLTMAGIGQASFTWSPDGTKFLYSSNRALDGTNTPISGCLFSGIPLAENAWVMNADGSGNLPLTNHTCNVISSADWSPDGQKIAFISNANLDNSDPTDVAAFESASSNVWSMSSDGSGTAPLTQLSGLGIGNAEGPMWSPDGTKIVYSSIRALDGSNRNNPFLNRNIWIMNADGSGSTPLTQLSSLLPVTFGNSCYSPHWSPNGSQIAMICIRPLDGTENGIAGDNLWIMNADGSGARPLTTFLSAFVEEPDLIDGTSSVSSNVQIWSPDGSKIAFLSSGSLDGSDGNSRNSLNLWVINPDGTGAAPLTTIVSSLPPPPPFTCSICLVGVNDFEWSPDGTQIAFISDMNRDGSIQPPHGFNLWVVNADGSKLTVLTDLTSGQSSLPRWQP
jgi:Tol biopolymer transport system component